MILGAILSLDQKMLRTNLAEIWCCDTNTLLVASGGGLILDPAGFGSYNLIYSFSEKWQLCSTQ